LTSIFTSRSPDLNFPMPSSIFENLPTRSLEKSSINATAMRKPAREIVEYIIIVLWNFTVTSSLTLAASALEWLMSLSDMSVNSLNLSSWRLIATASASSRSPFKMRGIIPVSLVCLKYSQVFLSFTTSCAPSFASS